MDYYDLLIKLAKKSLKSGDVPVGAVVVYDNKIISTGYNTREKKHSVINHAEINAIIKACKKLNNWNLSDCTLYITLKPCSMCMEIIKQCRIKNVYYILDKPSSKKEFSNVFVNKFSSYQQEKDYNNLLSNFFKELRNIK